MVFKTVCLKHITWPSFKHPKFRNIANIWFISIYSKCICFLFCLKHFANPLCPTFWHSYNTLPLIWSYWWTLGSLYCNETKQRGPDKETRWMVILIPSKEHALNILFFFFRILNAVNVQAAHILTSDQFSEYATKADCFFFFRGEDKHSQANEQEHI